MVGDGEGGLDVAVGVDDVGGDPPVVGVALHHAGDLAPVANPLQARHQQAAQHEQAHSGPVEPRMRHINSSIVWTDPETIPLG